MENQPSAHVAHRERQKLRLYLAIAATGMVLDLVGLLPGHMLLGIGIGWLINVLVNDAYDSRR